MNRARLRTAGICAAIFLATFAAYSPAIHGGRIWDDDAHITKPELQSWTGLGRIWFDLGATQQYYPALHSAFWVEHHLWGDSVEGYHLVNILLHAAAACLLGAILARLWSGRGASEAAAWLAAFVFALHPVCVESVAWISEQKNTLSMVFYLLAAIAYLRFDAGGAERPRAPARGHNDPPGKNLPLRSEAIQGSVAACGSTWLDPSNGPARQILGRP